ncbi:hypothetical protein [Actinoplanes sp. NPDC051851]|uniref:hypothetical protein n=1 Tax=Actinoplanes sp. NPDC051851 TaxID=3154753 RepID=UPI00342C312F
MRSRTALTIGAVAALVAGMPAPAQAATVRRRVAVVMLNFTDSPLKDAEATRERAAEDYFGMNGSLAAYYERMSGGTYHVVPAVDEKVIGPVEMPIAAACDTSAMTATAQAALSERGLTRDQGYDALSMIFNNDRARCTWAGLGSLPGPYTWLTDGISVGGVIHEFGHNVGLTHQMRLRCTDGDLHDCTEDGTSHKTPMGGGGAAQGLSAPEMIHTGWLPTRQVTTVRTSATYRLRPLHADGDRGPRALVIPMGDDRLVLEYRHHTGTLDPRVEGVHAYRVPGTSYNKAALIDLTPTDAESDNDAPPDSDAVTTLSDTSSKINIRVLSYAHSQATVSISFDAAPSPSPPLPAPTSASPSTPPAAPRPTAPRPSDSSTPATVTAAPVAATTPESHGSPPPALVAATLAATAVLAGAILPLLLIARRRTRRRKDEGDPGPQTRIAPR